MQYTKIFPADNKAWSWYSLVRGVGVKKAIITLLILVVLCSVAWAD
jgi:hypothetical protein